MQSLAVDLSSEGIVVAMTNSMSVSALRVDDQDFLVTSTIDRCPKVMMIRELLKNAIEAATLEDGGGLVEFSVTDVWETPKLTIWNSGPGMDDEELARMTNLAASIGKEKGLDKNFGMGAKVASLPSNRQGLRYRSCKDGRVHETILCEREGVYGRLRREDQEGNDLGDVIDVTQVVENEGLRSIDHDWTEVCLLGNRRNQNTAEDPYDGDPKQKKFWLANYLYHRFYRTPDNVEIKLLSGTHTRGDGTRMFKAIPERREAGFFADHETIELSNGIRIHYIYDEPLDGTSHNRSVSGSIASNLSTCSVVFQGEMYDVLKGRSWTLEAPTFGIPFGAKHISIHIELPDDYEVRADGYRQFLRYIDGEQSQVEASDFTAIVVENRPEWLVELVHSMAPNTGDSSDEIRNKLQEFLNRLRVRVASPKTDDEGDLDVDVGSGRGASAGTLGGSGSGTKRSKPDDLAIVATGSQMARLAQNLERAPKLIPLDDLEEIEAKQIVGRAGRYYLKSGELFINMRYPAVDEMCEMLRKEYAHAPDPELMQEMARGHARNTMIQRVGLAVVFALAKRLNKEWDDVAMDKALEPESLSLPADNFYVSLQDARRSLGRALKLSRMGTDSEQEEAESENFENGQSAVA
ncbi:ATP-binding protein [Qipengyuania zhejiangensis]|uniref:ATP-binding protein n=1 Tax=Qipengyuania zhejiangensis TaxID=3077782 RepID=UPI002D764B37|nr:ATP-binding protein [Qipengyuania sp. Z2]